LAGYGTQISALRVILTVRDGRTSFQISAVVAPTGGATAVKEIAVNGRDAQTDPEAQKPKVDPESGNGENQAGGKKLKYPFTLLEIRENAEISADPVSPPTQA
jgi:hypothetical protein